MERDHPPAINGRTFQTGCLTRLSSNRTPREAEFEKQFEEPFCAVLADPFVAGDWGRLGRYRVLDPLKLGTMGLVLRVFDPQLEREAVIKLDQTNSHPDTSATQSQSLHEARAVAALHHPAIVPVYDVGEWRGRVY